MDDAEALAVARSLLMAYLEVNPEAAQSPESLLSPHKTFLGGVRGGKEWLPVRLGMYARN